MPFWPICVGILLSNDRSRLCTMHSMHFRRVRSFVLCGWSGSSLPNLQLLHVNNRAAVAMSAQPNVEEIADATAVQLSATWSTVQDSRGAAAEGEVQQVWIGTMLLRCYRYTWKRQSER
ncbi:hypothetical protein V7S43_001120 [Phytophthora oleae]|uniref:Uncharacterized protein n=1 Tax=Phytophthora oleae TaxID=2107226 RepID=A0ABD3G2R2_9STRA